MQMPVVVGIILSVMFLVTLSGWFYNFATGMREAVLDDKFFNLRIVWASLVSVAFFVGVFFIISIVNECPNEKREGIFAGLNCEEYSKLKASTNLLFKPNNKAVDQPL
jgi:hypothetical protein